MVFQFSASAIVSSHANHLIVSRATIIIAVVVAAVDDVDSAVYCF